MYSYTALRLHTISVNQTYDMTKMYKAPFRLGYFKIFLVTYMTFGVASAAFRPWPRWFESLVPGTKLSMADLWSEGTIALKKNPYELLWKMTHAQEFKNRIVFSFTTKAWVYSPFFNFFHLTKACSSITTVFFIGVYGDTKSDKVKKSRTLQLTTAACSFRQCLGKPGLTNTASLIFLT